jgi:hypothetical protein
MSYLLKTGFNLPDGKGGEVRKEAGEIIEQIEDAELWLASGDIEEVAPAAPEHELPAKRKRKTAPPSTNEAEK